MAKIKEDVAVRLVEFMAEIHTPQIIDYVKKNVVKYLPDIDKVEEDDIRTGKALARAYMNDWRNYRSLEIAVWEMLLWEQDKNKRELLSRLHKELSKEAMKALHRAVYSHISSETKEKYGLLKHGYVKLEDLLAGVVPIILMFVAGRR